MLMVSHVKLAIKRTLERSVVGADIKIRWIELPSKVFENQVQLLTVLRQNVRLWLDVWYGHLFSVVDFVGMLF